jgi:hypothetical protein
MTQEEEKALLTLKDAGWVLLLGVGGTPVGGLCNQGRRKKDATESELNAVSALLTLGWEQENEDEDYPWIPSLIAPPNRAHEYLFDELEGPP